jgi:hypothetical protein
MQDEQILITPGDYPLTDIVAGVCGALALVPREIGRVVYLGPSPGTVTPKERALLYEAEVHWKGSLWRSRFEWLIPSERVLQAVGSVWELRDCVSGMVKPISELNDAQRSFISRQFSKDRTGNEECEGLLDDDDMIILIPGFAFSYCGVITKEPPARPGGPPIYITTGQLTPYQ